MEVFDLDDPVQFEKFAKGNPKIIGIRGTNLTVEYDDMKRIGGMLSKLGAPKAISVGAYSFALSRIDEKEERDD